MFREIIEMRTTEKYVLFKASFVWMYIARTVCHYCFLLCSFFSKALLAQHSRFRLRARSELNPVFRRVQLDFRGISFICTNTDTHVHILRQAQCKSNRERSVYYSDLLFHSLDLIERYH